MAITESGGMWSKASSLLQNIIFQVGLIFFTLIMLEILSWVAITLRHSNDPAEPWTEYQLRNGMKVAGMDAEVTKRVMWEQDDMERVYAPYHVWNEQPNYNGKYIKINEYGERFIPASADKKTAEKKIWMTGGSTMWGLGVTDEQTIPNHLAKIIRQKDNMPVEIVNLGDRGFVLNQEVIRIIEKLRDGETPDIVILYTGINDAYYGTYYPGVVGYHAHYWDIKERVEKKESDMSKFVHLFKKTGIGRMFEAVSSRMQGHKKTTFYHSSEEYDKQITEEIIDQRAKELVTMWSSLYSIMEDLSIRRGFDFYFILPPEIHEHALNRPFMEYEETMVNRNWTQKSLYAKSAFYREIKKLIHTEKRDNVIDLTGAFDNVTDKVFYDICHLNSRGNEIIADEFYKAIRPSLLKGKDEAQQNIPQEETL